MCSNDHQLRYCFVTICTTVAIFWIPNTPPSTCTELLIIVIISCHVILFQSHLSFTAHILDNIIIQMCALLVFSAKVVVWVCLAIYLELVDQLSKHSAQNTAWPLALICLFFAPKATKIEHVAVTSCTWCQSQPSALSSQACLLATIGCPSHVFQALPPRGGSGADVLFLLGALWVLAQPPKPYFRPTGLMGHRRDQDSWLWEPSGAPLEGNLPHPEVVLLRMECMGSAPPREERSTHIQGILSCWEGALAQERGPEKFEHSSTHYWFRIECWRRCRGQDSGHVPQSGKESARGGTNEADSNAIKGTWRRGSYSNAIKGTWRRGSFESDWDSLYDLCYGASARPCLLSKPVKCSEGCYQSRAWSLNTERTWIQAYACQTLAWRWAMVQAWRKMCALARLLRAWEYWIGVNRVLHSPELPAELARKQFKHS